MYNDYLFLYFENVFKKFNFYFLFKIIYFNFFKLF
jgi:hypothetical protein